MPPYNKTNRNRGNLTTEFKREYTEEIKKTIVAFANTSGGILYIGVNNDKSIAGVDKPDDTLLQVINAIRSAVKPDITLFVDYKMEKIGETSVIVVTIQRGTVCPYYLAGKGIRPEGVYVRQGPSSVPATETAILNMIKETDGTQYEAVRSLNQDLISWGLIPRPSGRGRFIFISVFCIFCDRRFMYHKTIPLFRAILPLTSN